MDHHLITTAFTIDGYRIKQNLGVVRGIVVRSPSIGQGIVGGLKQIVGGNIREYAEVCESARSDAYRLLVQHAAEVGADAIIGMRYDATEFSQGATEVLAYGTAVKIMLNG